MPKKDMGLKRKNLTGYMGGGVFKPNAPVSSSFRGGGATEVGTEKKVQSYKKYAKKMFGGGISSASAADSRRAFEDAKDKGRNQYDKRTPKKVKKKRPVFTPTKADDRGLNTGGPTEMKPIISTKKKAKKQAPKAKVRRKFARIPGSGDGKGGKKTKDLTGPTRGSRKFKTAAAKKKARAPKRFQKQSTGGGAKKAQLLRRKTGGGGG